VSCVAVADMKLGCDSVMKSKCVLWAEFFFPRFRRRLVGPATRLRRKL